MAVRGNLKTNKMTKKTFYLTTLSLGLFLLVQPTLYAQDKTEQKKKPIERPSKCDVKEVDEYVSKTFDAYDESQKITEDINFIKVEGDGKTAPKSLKNGKGEVISKETALAQLGDLKNRVKKQNENIKILQELQKPAQESLKKCSFAQKPKAAKSIGKGGEALIEVVKQTKAQAELIEKQLVDIKTMKK